MTGLPLFEAFLGLLFVGYIVSGLDDLVFDAVYWLRRLLRGPWERPVRASELAAVPPQPAAILVPAWREGDVIAETLLYNGQIVDYPRHDIFLGVYPNDQHTQERVDWVAERLGNVNKCVLPEPGPTTKADALNGAFAAMRRVEAERGERYGFVVIHDAEDVVHPLELRLLNLRFSEDDRVAMIQTPILALEPPRGSAAAGTYLDEFAEVQTKDMHVRDLLGGFIPSCGVATGFRRSTLDRLAGDGGDPFRGDVLTEDYEVGLRVALEGMESSFERRRVVEDLPVPAGRIEPATPDPARIATWGGFPERFGPAVRQRTRWILGIVFQSRTGQRASPGALNRWLLFHDRKGLWTYPLIALGYLAVLGVTLLYLADVVLGAGWRTVLPSDAWILWGSAITLLLLANRLAQRALAVGRVYGRRQALLSFIRQPWTNVINIAALTRAVYQHLDARLSDRAVGWDHTEHSVPQVIRPRIGALMVRGGWISQGQLEEALREQTGSGRPLGETLVALGHVSPARRDLALEAQDALEGKR